MGEDGSGSLDGGMGRDGGGSLFRNLQFSLVQSLSRVWLCSMPGFPVYHQLLNLVQTRPLSWWCHPTISSSVILFSSCLQSFPESGSFSKNQFSESGVPGSSLGRIQGIPSGWMASAREKERERERERERHVRPALIGPSLCFTFWQQVLYPFSERFQGTRCLLMITQD